MKTLVIAALLAVAVAPAALAQDPRLTSKLDRETVGVVSRIVDSARVAGLPTEPLIAKALEGASKRAPGDRIAATVRSYASALHAASAALGARSTEPEIVAGAGAILSGIDPAALTRLRTSGASRSLTMPLVVLADLVSRGVQSDTAAGAVYLATRAGARDTDFLALRRAVEQDIRSGASPAAATALRVRTLPGVAGYEAGAFDPLRPPGTTTPRRTPP
jgi:hypothetical protein